MILAEQDEEWHDGRCYFRPETMNAIGARVLVEEVGQPPARKLINAGARTTPCYTMCWDLTSADGAVASGRRLGVAQSCYPARELTDRGAAPN